jgi:hypothetical protein
VGLCAIDQPIGPPVEQARSQVGLSAQANANSRMNVGTAGTCNAILRITPTKEMGK